MNTILGFVWIGLAFIFMLADDGKTSIPFWAALTIANVYIANTIGR